MTDLGRLTELRVDLEGYAARLAAERATAAEGEAMAQLAQELDSLGEVESDLLIRLDQRIHREVWQAAHNHFLEAACEQYFTHSLRHWFLVLHLVHLKEAVVGHGSLLLAVLDGDPVRAESAMRRLRVLAGRGATACRTRAAGVRAGLPDRGTVAAAG